MTPEDVRRAARAQTLTGPTAGLAAGFVQGNVVVLPSDVADDFRLFCELNPKPCPLIAVTEIGRPHVPSVGGGIDLRIDLPRYRVWRDGERAEDEHCVSFGRRVRGPARGVDAAVRRRGRDSRGRNYVALSHGARRAGAPRRSGADRN